MQHQTGDVDVEHRRDGCGVIVSNGVNAYTLASLTRISSLRYATGIGGCAGAEPSSVGLGAAPLRLLEPRSRDFGRSSISSEDLVHYGIGIWARKTRTSALTQVLGPTVFSATSGSTNPGQI